jgi:hypothetical protein
VSSLSISPLKLDSGKKPKYDQVAEVFAPELLPALSVYNEKTENEDETSSTPDFETWLKEQKNRYDEFVKSRREEKTRPEEGCPRSVFVVYFSYCILILPYH